MGALIALIIIFLVSFVTDYFVADTENIFFMAFMKVLIVVLALNVGYFWESWNW